MDALNRDITLEILARLAPGRDAIVCTRVCRKWWTWLRTEWAYLRMIQATGRPSNNHIFGAGEGTDPNYPTGLQLELRQWSAAKPEFARVRDAIRNARTAKALLGVLYGSRVDRKVRCTAMDLYLRFDHAPLWCICSDETLDKEEQAEMVRILLYAGANVDLTGGSGVRSTPLQQAVRCRSPLVITLLLLAGAVADKYGGSFQQTPLILAAGEVGDATITQRLVAAGANVAAVDDDGRQAIHRAIEFRRLDVLQYFAELLRWVVIGDSPMARPILLYYSSKSFSLLPDARLCAKLCAVSDWLEGALFFVKHGIITVEELRGYAFELCSEPNLSCPMLRQWLRDCDDDVVKTKCRGCSAMLCKAEGERAWVRVALFHTRAQGNADATFTPDTLPTEKLEDVLFNVFRLRSWRTLLSLLTLGYVDPLQLVLTYCRHVVGRLPISKSTFMQLDHFTTCVASLHEMEEGLRSVCAGSKSRVAQLQALFPPLEGPQYFVALLENVHSVGGAPFCWTLDNLCKRGATLDVEALVARVATLPAHLTLCEVASLLKLAPTLALRCNEQGDTILHLLARIPQCTEPLMRQVHNWARLREGNLLRNAADKTAAMLADELGHPLAAILHEPGETEEEREAAAWIARDDLKSGASRPARFLNHYIHQAAAAVARVAAPAQEPDQVEGGGAGELPDPEEEARREQRQAMQGILDRQRERLVLPDDIRNANFDSNPIDLAKLRATWMRATSEQLFRSVMRDRCLPSEGGRGTAPSSLLPKLPGQKRDLSDDSRSNTSDDDDDV